MSENNYDINSIYNGKLRKKYNSNYDFADDLKYENYNNSKINSIEEFYAVQKLEEKKRQKELDREEQRYIHSMDESRLADLFYEIFPQIYKKLGSRFHVNLLGVVHRVVSSGFQKRESQFELERKLEDYFSTAKKHWEKFIQDNSSFQNVDRELSLRPFIKTELFLAPSLAMVSGSERLFLEKLAKWHEALLEIPRKKFEKFSFIKEVLMDSTTTFFNNNSFGNGKWENQGAIQLITELIVYVAESMDPEKAAELNVKNTIYSLDAYLALDPILKDKFFEDLNTIWQKFYTSGVGMKSFVNPHLQMGLHVKAKKDGIEDLSLEALGAIYGVELNV